MLRLRSAVGVLALLGAAAGLRAQTDIWIGDLPDNNASSPNNWVGGAVPGTIDAGTDTLFMTNNAATLLVANTAMSFNGVSLSEQSDGNANFFILGSSPVSIGSGGITMTTDVDDDSVNLTIGAPLMLSGNQSWTGGNVAVTGLMQGTGSLALGLGSVYTFTNGTNTYTGLILVQNAADVLVTANGHALGYGTVEVQDGGAIYVPTGSTIFEATALQIGNNSMEANTYFGAYSQDNSVFTKLTFTSSVSLVPYAGTGSQYISLTNNSEVVFTGNFSELSPANVVLSTTSGNSSTPGIVVLQGLINNVTGFTLSGQDSLIFNGASPSQLTSSAVTSLATNQGSTAYFNGSYVGFGANYAGNVVTAMAGFLGSTAQQNAFTGTLGFDTVSGTTAVFTDAINLNNFTNEAFIGLGSATSAILAGTIEPVNDAFGFGGTKYQFGGGGGMLTVNSALTDGSESPNSLVMLPGNAPLTLVLGGTTSYTGPTSVDGGVLIFDAPVSSNAIRVGEASTVFGYAGNTPAAGFVGNEQGFLSLFDAGSQGVAGFDDLSATRTVSSGLTLGGDTGLYLGTATNVTFTGAITPANDNNYRFAGVKGGVVTVDTTLSGENGLIIGLPSPLESFGSVSTVILPNANTYLGSTTLNSGYLEVGTGGISTGSLIIAGPPDDGTGTIVGVQPYGGSVTLANNISLPFEGAHFNYGGSPDTLTLTGVISDTEDAGKLIVDGPVILTNSQNNYSGGTVVNGTTLEVTSDTALGQGGLTAKGGAAVTMTSMFPSIGNSGLVELVDSSLSFTAANGQPSITDLVMEAGSTLNFAANSDPIIYFMESDLPNSNNTINLGAGTHLQFNFDADPDFHGTITGATGSIEVSGGSLNLTGANTYGGGTTIDSFSTVIASNSSALGTGPVQVYGTLGVNTGVTLTNALAFQNDSVLAGYGTLSPGGTVTIQNGITIAPGVGGTNVSNQLLPPAGALTFGGGTSVAFGPNGNYNFAVTDANGVAGVGYSTLNISGGLSITANSDSPFTIFVYSFAANNTSTGQNGVANFYPTSAYSWLLATATGGITGFSTSAFSVSTANFVNSLGTGNFSVSANADQLFLNFDPVPEPSTVLLLLAGVGAVGAAVRRRRRR